MKRFFIILSFLLLFMTFHTSCSLHTHYLDEYGVCKHCGKEVAITISYDDGVYSCNDFYCGEQDYTYLKFVAQSASPIAITFEEGSATIDNSNCIFLYTESISNLSLTHIYGESVWTYSTPLTVGETYYIKIAVKTAGEASISIAHVS